MLVRCRDVEFFHNIHEAKSDKIGRHIAAWTLVFHCAVVFAEWSSSASCLPETSEGIICRQGMLVMAEVMSLKLDIDSDGLQTERAH